MRLATTVVLFVAFITVGCEGPEGPMGPEGPQGPPGPQGPVGNANVETATFSVSEEDFEDDGERIEAAPYDTDILTAEVVSDGAVLAYSDIFTGWTALPFSIPVDENYTMSVTYTYNEGRVVLSIIRPGGSEPAGASTFDGTNLKVVAIPPADASGVTQGMTYEELNARFGLE